jgi:hypothetical protein
MVTKDERIGFRVRADIKEKLLRQAAIERRSPSQLAAIIINDYCDAQAEARKARSAKQPVNGHSHRVAESAS